MNLNDSERGDWMVYARVYIQGRLWPVPIPRNTRTRQYRPAEMHRVIRTSSV